jgi:hypothetical protein
MAAEISARHAFERLADTLRERRLSWLVEQVQDRIREGKPVVRSIKELHAERQNWETVGEAVRGEKLKPGRRVEFRTTEEFTEEEQLDLLLSAIRQAVLNAAAIEETVGVTFPGLSFVSEQGDGRFSAPTAERDRRSSSLKQLRSAIDELSAQLNR